MSAIAMQTGKTALSVVESLEQDTHPANVDITAPAIIKQNSAGKWALAVAADTNTYLALRTVKAGAPLTGLKRGVVDGLELSALAIEAVLYSNAASIPDTATSTNAQVIGQVIAAHSNTFGTSADKLFRVNLP